MTIENHHQHHQDKRSTYAQPKHPSPSTAAPFPPSSSTKSGHPARQRHGRVTDFGKQLQTNVSHHVLGLFSGGVAGALGKTCTAPLARLTILSQVEGMHATVGTLSRLSIAQQASRIITEEGVRALWKGNGVTIVHRFPYTAVSLYAHERYKKVLFGKEEKHEGFGKILLAGGAAGVTGASIAYPLDLVRTRLSAQRNEKYYKGITHALCTIRRDEGFRGLYKGMGATLLYVGPSIALNFSIFETLKAAWSKRSSDPPGACANLVFGGISGTISSTITYPFDLVRRRMQLEGAQGKGTVHKTSVPARMLDIARRGGVRGLYRGLLPELLKVVPTTGIMFMTNEFLKSHIPNK